MSSSRNEVSTILETHRPGPPDLAEPDTRRLFELAYEDLKVIAARELRRERDGHTLQTTALVHEVYLRLVDQSVVHEHGRVYFLAIAARAMRQVLVDHARRRGSRKRGGDLKRVSLDENASAGSAIDLLETLAMDDALTRLSSKHERVARVAEMKIFGGIPTKDVARALGIGERTVYEDWAFARAWLQRTLSQGGGSA